ncbi:MAG: hypothetical protein E7055_11110 [Lentisphaerae bacterium]|nr:hypothetical protein [Lentisphaerota bacterium]
MKNLAGCLLVLIGLPLAAVILYLLAFVVYFLFNIVLYFLPLLVVIAIVLALPWLAYQFCKGLNS